MNKTHVKKKKNNKSKEYNAKKISILHIGRKSFKV